MLRAVHSVWACKNDPLGLTPSTSSSVWMQPNAIGAGTSKPQLSANEHWTDLCYILPCKFSFLLPSFFPSNFTSLRKFTHRGLSTKTWRSLFLSHRQTESTCFSHKMAFFTWKMDIAVSVCNWCMVHRCSALENICIDYHDVFLIRCLWIQIYFQPCFYFKLHNKFSSTGSLAYPNAINRS